MTSPLRVAVVGAGLMGGWHARYAAAAGARIAAIVDVDTVRAQKLGARFRGAGVFAHLDECLRAAALDVVHICTPSDRVPLAEQALGAGLHVLVEKPAALVASDARRLLDQARQRSVRVCPVHQFGFQPGFRRIVARRARLGAIVRIEGTAFSAGGDGRAPRERREILLGIVPHFVSLCRAVAGNGVEWQRLHFTDDDLELRATHADAVLAIRVSLRARPRRNELVVVGTTATARADLYHGFATFEAAADTPAAKALRPFLGAAHSVAASAGNLLGRAFRAEPAFPGLRALIASFYASIRGYEPPPLPDEELIETAALLERLRA